MAHSMNCDCDICTAAHFELRGAMSAESLAIHAFQAAKRPQERADAQHRLNLCTARFQRANDALMALRGFT